jgi:ribonuclease P protein component
MVATPGDRATLPRGERLRGRHEIEHLFRRGVRLERAGFVLLWAAIPGRRAAAFAAGRRLGGSVTRNRARRRLREAYRHVKHLAPARGIRLCFVARARALDVPFATLSHEVADAMRHAARHLAS